MTSRTPMLVTLVPLFAVVLACPATPDPAAPDPSPTPAPEPSPSPTPSSTPTPSPTPEPTPDPPPTVRLDPSLPLQTLDGVGANAYPFPIQSADSWVWESVAPTLEELGLDYVRIVSWFKFWESENDDDDPWHIEWSGFETETPSMQWWDLPFAEWLDARDIEPTLGIWDTADWLAGGEPRRIDPAMYDELGESIAAYYLSLRAAGIELPYGEVQNEPNIEAHIRYDSPEDLRDAARIVLAHLDDAGFEDVMLHGPNSNHADEVLPWAKVWLADEALAARTVAISFHTWSSADFADYDAIRQLAEAHGKQVWATELGYCPVASGCDEGTHFLASDTWGTAFDASVSAWRAITWSRANRVYHWAALGYDATMSTTGERYPTWYSLKQLADAVPPGAVHLTSTADDPDLLVMGFALPQSESLSAVLINAAEEERTARIGTPEGGPWTVVDAVTSSEGSYGVAAAVDGTGQLTLPAQSVTSLRLQP